MRILRSLGFIFVGVGLLALANAVDVRAQSDDAEYMGSDECGSCHRDLRRPHAASAHANALLKVSSPEDREALVGDFSAGAEVRTLDFPGEAEPRAFGADDIAFAIGYGRHAQRYVYESESGQLLVLPVEWNVQEGSWQAFVPTDEWSGDNAIDFTVSCAGCHTSGFDPVALDWEEEGVQCEACHGPGSAHIDTADEAGRRPSDEEFDAIRGAIVRSPDPQTCGRCHSQGADAETGLPFAAGYHPGANLFDGYSLVASEDTAHWWPDGHAKAQNMQFNEWFESKHASSLETLKSSNSAEDACLQCHSADYSFNQRLMEAYDEGWREGAEPTQATLETAKFGITCIACHNPHSEEDDIDFLLRDESSYNLCVSCHTATDVTPEIHHPVQQMFEGESPVTSISNMPSVHYAADQGIECTTCHMDDVPVNGLVLATHSLKPVLPDPQNEELENTCAGCHTDLATHDLAYLVEDIQAAVRSRLVVNWARVGGLPVPAADDPAAVQYAEVVTALSFVQNDGSLGIHNYALADELLTFAERGLSQLSVPGANLEPTEGPAPTATSDALPAAFIHRDTEASGGLHPITTFVVGIGILWLAVSGLIFYRSRRGES